MIEITRTKSAKGDLEMHRAGCADLTKKARQYQNRGDEAESYKGETLVEAIIAADEDMASWFGLDAYDEDAEETAWTVRLCGWAPCFQEMVTKARVDFDALGRPSVPAPTATPAAKACTTAGCDEPRIRPSALKCTMHEAEYKAAAKARKEAAAAVAPVVVSRDVALRGVGVAGGAPTAREIYEDDSDGIKAAHEENVIKIAKPKPVKPVKPAATREAYVPRTMKNLGDLTPEQKAAQKVLASLEGDASDPRWMPAMRAYVGPARFPRD